jgi:TonB-dependent SusC/RagA subfamily outer membrane receptor
MLIEMETKLFLLTLIFFAMFFDLSAQKTNKKIAITGKVTDLYSNPVSGAFIMIDGKSTERKTNDQGLFKIKVNPSAQKIGIFTTFTEVEEEPINGRTTINFILDKSVPLQINPGKGVSDDEVVNEGYSVARKKNITKPVTKSDVTGNEYASFSSIYEVLRTVPGVSVSGNRVTVRGISTTGSSTPLFVVNGTPVNSINGINPSMVKSIEVLKGPSASVYGLQGANGVIIIHLKGTD